jgi:hypothetical protein
MEKSPDQSSPGRQRLVVIVVGIVIVIGVGLALFLSVPRQAEDEDRVLREMISQVDAAGIYQTTYDLQNFSTREYPSPENRRAAEYLHDRLAAMPGLEVEYQSDKYRNVIATLPGEDAASDEIVLVGAHYDSTSSDPDRAPGASDNAGGAAIVLELARVMSRYHFNHTVQFAFWNAEEDSRKGSREYVASAEERSLDIPLYMNYDSTSYDPDDRSVLDVMYNNESAPFSKLYAKYNSQYEIGFNLTYNVHDCGSDHTSFWKEGYTAITTHTEKHAPDVHTPQDTIDSVSPAYAAKNARLGMLILADTADLRR